MVYRRKGTLTEPSCNKVSEGGAQREYCAQQALYYPDRQCGQHAFFRGREKTGNLLPSFVFRWGSELQGTMGQLVRKPGQMDGESGANKQPQCRVPQHGDSEMLK